MKRLLAPASLVLLTMAIAFAECDGNDNSLPKKYVGFEKSEREVAYKPSDDQIEIQVKIVAVDKSKEDRVVLIESPQSSQSTISQYFRIKENKITLPAGKKSVKATIILYPKKVSIIRKIQLTCRPQVPDAEVSRLSISLIKK